MKYAIGTVIVNKVYVREIKQKEYLISYDIKVYLNFLNTQ